MPRSKHPNKATDEQIQDAKNKIKNSGTSIDK
jgi:hypothetical protein